MSDVVESTIPLDTVKAAIINAAPAQHRAALELCEFRKLSDGDFIPVLVVDSPEKWLAADMRKVTMSMELPGNNRVLRIPMRGLSMTEWTNVEQTHPIPEWNAEEDGPEPGDFQQLKTDAIDNRVIAIMEIATGQKFPGESLEAKREWLRKRNEAECDAIRAFIRRNLQNFSNDNAPLTMPLLNRYELDQSLQPINEVEFASFEDWKAATEVEHVLRFQRWGDPYIVEIPMRSLSAELSNSILENTKEPTPPKVPMRDALTGTFIRGEDRYNRHDMQYLRKLRAANQLRLAKFCNACLMFAIPGENELAQYQWLAGRLAGDVTRVQSFIENDILGITARYNFFSNS